MKKDILWTSLGVGIVIVIVLMLGFVFFSDSQTSTSPVSEINLEGTWKVAAHVNDGSVEIVEDEYIVFSGDRVAAYKNNDSSPYISSKFDLMPDSAYPNQTLSLIDLSRSITLIPSTDNYIRLYQSKTAYTELIRYADETQADLIFDYALLNGTWNVVYRNTAEIISHEQLVFSDGQLFDYRNDLPEPVATSTYSWKDNCITADAWNMELLCYPLSSNWIFFVEVETGYIWELSRAS